MEAIRGYGPESGTPKNKTTNHGDLFPRVDEIAVKNRQGKNYAGCEILPLHTGGNVAYCHSRAVTGRADGVRLARRERTRADFLRYCYPPASIARAGAGARPMSLR